MSIKGNLTYDDVKKPEGKKSKTGGFEMGFFKIPVKLYSIVLVLLIAAGGIVFYTVNTLEKQKGDTNVINLAGKQRMLTQKLSKAMMELQLGDIAKAKEVAGISEEFQQVLRGLKIGDASLNLPPAETPEILAKLNATQKIWDDFSVQVNAVNQGWPKVQAELDAITGTNVDLFNEANEVVVALGKVMDAQTVSVSGRLRAITQRVSKAILEFALYRKDHSAAEATKFMTLQNRIIEGLLKGDPSLTLKQVADPAAIAKIKAFRANWDVFQKHVENM